MVFPPDVRGTYRAPERDIAVHQGITELRSVVAEVTRDTIVFREIPQGAGSQDIEVYSKNMDSTGYDPLKRGPQTAVVRIDGNKHYGHPNAPTPIVFNPTDNKTFEFDYLVPRYDDEPWTFTKTDETGHKHNVIHKPKHVTHTPGMSGMDAKLMVCFKVASLHNTRSFVEIF